MAILTSKDEMVNAVPGDSIYLASFTRVKETNGMWSKKLDPNGDLVVGTLTAEEIQSMGFILGEDAIGVDELQDLGVEIAGIDYQDLSAPLLADIGYGDLNAGSEPDVNYGTLL